MFELKAQMYFAAAHHLLNYEGECENQHGHNWKVEAYFAFETKEKAVAFEAYLKTGSGHAFAKRHF